MKKRWFVWRFKGDEMFYLCYREEFALGEVVMHLPDPTPGLEFKIVDYAEDELDAADDYYNLEYHAHPSENYQHLLGSKRLWPKTNVFKVYCNLPFKPSWVTEEMWFDDDQIVWQSKYPYFKCPTCKTIHE